MTHTPHCYLNTQGTQKALVCMCQLVRRSDFEPPSMSRMRALYGKWTTDRNMTQLTLLKNQKVMYEMHISVGGMRTYPSHAHISRPTALSTFS